MHEPPTGVATQPAAHARVVYLRMPSVRQRTGLGRSTIYRMIAMNEFPPQFRLAGRAVGWRESDIDHWAQSRTPNGVAPNVVHQLHAS